MDALVFRTTKKLLKKRKILATYYLAFAFLTIAWVGDANSIHRGFLEHLNSHIIHVYLIRRFQKYGKNWILTVAFWWQTKAGQKFAARWAELAVLFCR